MIEMASYNAIFVIFASFLISLAHCTDMIACEGDTVIIQCAFNKDKYRLQHFDVIWKYPKSVPAHRITIDRSAEQNAIMFFLVLHNATRRTDEGSYLCTLIDNESQRHLESQIVDLRLSAKHDGTMSEKQFGLPIRWIFVLVVSVIFLVLAIGGCVFYCIKIRRQHNSERVYVTQFQAMAPVKASANV